MATVVEEFVGNETGLRWGYDSDGYVWCEGCNGRERWPCPVCNGASNHWCELDIAAMNGHGDYCDWSIDCGRCENTGTEHCATCEG